MTQAIQDNIQFQVLTTYGKAGLGRNKAASVGKIASAVVFKVNFTKPLGFCHENHRRKGDQSPSQFQPNKWSIYVGFHLKKVCTAF